MKETIVNARKILQGSNMDRTTQTKNLVEKISLDQKEIESALRFLIEHGLAKIETAANFEYQTFLVTAIGKDVAEEWRNEDRWQFVIQVCEKLDNYSYHTIIKILEKLIDADINKHICRS